MSRIFLEIPPRVCWKSPGNLFSEFVDTLIMFVCRALSRCRVSAVVCDCRSARSISRIRYQLGHSLLCSRVSLGTRLRGSRSVHLWL